MVSTEGAPKVQPLLDEIAALEAAVAKVGGAIAGGATLWKMDANVYINQASANLSMSYALTAEETAGILRAVEAVLQARLTARSKDLAGIT